MTFKIATEYYVVELNGSAPVEVIEWVRDRFGDGRDGRWTYLLNKFYFQEKSDHLMFTIKWS